MGIGWRPPDCVSGTLRLLAMDHGRSNDRLRRPPPGIRWHCRRSTRTFTRPHPAHAGPALALAGILLSKPLGRRPNAIRPGRHSAHDHGLRRGCRHGERLRQHQRAPIVGARSILHRFDRARHGRACLLRIPLLHPPPRHAPDRPHRDLRAGRPAHVARTTARGRHARLSDIRRTPIRPAAGRLPDPHGLVHRQGEPVPGAGRRHSLADCGRQQGQEIDRGHAPPMASAGPRRNPRRTRVPAAHPAHPAGRTRPTRQHPPLVLRRRNRARHGPGRWHASCLCNPQQPAGDTPCRSSAP